MRQFGGAWWLRLAPVAMVAGLIAVTQPWRGLPTTDATTHDADPHLTVVDRRRQPTYQSVDGFTQDAQGFVWLATSSGAVRYTGTFFDTYAAGSEDGSPVSDSTPDIVADAHRGVWVASGTLRHLDPWSATGTKYDLKAERIAGDGSHIWAYHDGVFTLVEPTPDGLVTRAAVPHDSTAVAGDMALRVRDGKLYIGDATGITVVSPSGQSQSYTIPSGVTALAYRAEGGVWMSSPSGLWYFDGHFRPSRVVAMSNLDGQGSRRPTSVVERADGSIWVGYASGLVDVFDPLTGAWTPATQLPASTGQVTATFEDRSGGLWIGRSGDAVARLGATPFVRDVIPLTFESDSNPRPKATSIAFGRNGELLAATNSAGLQQFAPDTRTWARRDELNLPSQRGSVQGIDELTAFRSTKNFDWLATWGGGLYRVDPETNRIDALALKDSAYINLAVPDTDDRLWIASPGYGVLAVSEAGRPLYQFGAMSTPHIANLRVDAIWAEHDRVLIGGDAGLEIIDLASGRVQRFSAESGALIGRTVRDIVVDANGVIWLATNAGLERLAPGDTKSTVPKSFRNTASHSAQALVSVDDNTKLWVATDESMMLVDTRTAALVAVVDSSDGLPSGPSLLQSVARGPDGSTYVVATSGIIRLTPDPGAQAPPTSPRLYARCVVGCNIASSGQTDVSPSEVRFEFDATGRLADPEYRVEYRLVGADDAPRMAEIGDSSASYRSLPAGTYHLEARAIDSTGRTIAKASSPGPGDPTRFTINERWWESDQGRFALVALLVLIALGWLGLSQRANRRRRIQLEATVSERTRELDRARHAAEEGLAAKSRLMSQVSHELRSPLTSINGGADLLMLTELTEVQRRHTATIAASGQHLASLIDDLVDVGLRDGSAFTTRLGSVDIYALVESVVEASSSRARRGTFRFDLFIDPELHGRYITDAKRLRQVLSNLIDNAVNHSGGSLVTVTVERLLDESDTPTALHESIRFTVRDNAGTFDAEEFERLAEPFERNYNTGVGGLGLGLAITTGILQRFGSRLEVDVEPGISTSFSFRLALQHPIRDRDGLESVVPTVGTTDGHTDQIRPRPPRALVVDDERMVRQLFVLMLTHLGWSAIEASSGEDAIALAREFDIDLVLTDVMTAPMAGNELAGRLREVTDVPIIAITGAALTDRRPFNAVLHKPVRLTDLETALATQFASATWFDAP